MHVSLLGHFFTFLKGGGLKFRHWKMRINRKSSVVVLNIVGVFFYSLSVTPMTLFFSSTVFLTLIYKLSIMHDWQFVNSWTVNSCFSSSGDSNTWLKWLWFLGWQYDGCCTVVLFWFARCYSQCWTTIRDRISRRPLFRVVPGHFVNHEVFVLHLKKWNFVLKRRHQQVVN